MGILHRFESRVHSFQLACCLERKMPDNPNSDQSCKHVANNCSQHVLIFLVFFHVSIHVTIPMEFPSLPPQSVWTSGLEVMIVSAASQLRTSNLETLRWLISWWCPWMQNHATNPRKKNTSHHPQNISYIQHLQFTGRVCTSHNTHTSLSLSLSLYTHVYLILLYHPYSNYTAVYWYLTDIIENQ